MHLTPETPCGGLRTDQACGLRWPQGFVCPRCGGRRARPSRRGLLLDGKVHDFPSRACRWHLVSDHVVGDQPEKRGERTGTAKHLGSGKLPYRLGVAAQAAARDGAARPRTAQRSRGGRRDLCGGRRRGTARTADAEKSTGSHRRRGRRRGDRKDPYEAHPAERPSNSCTASSKRLSSPTARSTPTAGKGTSAWRRLAIGTSTTFWPARASRPPSCCPTFNVAALLKRVVGTHQGAVSLEHLDYYRRRFNRRRSRHRGKLFYRLVQQAATVGPTTYSEMVQHLRGRRRRRGRHLPIPLHDGRVSAARRVHCRGRRGRRRRGRSQHGGSPPPPELRPLIAPG